MQETMICECCGGTVAKGSNGKAHQKRCRSYKKEGVDHICCRECGFKSTQLTKHIKIHGFTTEEYREKYPDAPLYTDAINKKRGETYKRVMGFF